MSELGERVASLEAYQKTMNNRLGNMETTLNTVAKDIHGAKVGGRIILGVALIAGAVVGWVINMVVGS